MPTDTLAPPPATQPAPKPAPASPPPEAAPSVFKPQTTGNEPAEIPDSENPFFKLEKEMGLAEPEPKKEDKPPEEEKTEEVSEKPTDDAVKADKDAKTIKQKSEGGKLREERDRIAKELETERKTRTELETKLKDAKPAEEITKLSERLASIEKERDEARSEVMMLKQESTPEFKQKYEQPFNDAAEASAEFVAQLVVMDDQGNRRQADWKTDFAGIYQLPYLQARERAKEMFGEDAPAIMQQYNQLKALERVANKAREVEKATWKETTAQKIAEETRVREASTAALKSAMEGLTKKYPDRFAEDPNDPEANKWLAKGRELLEKVPQTFQEHVSTDAAKRLAIMAHPRLVYRISKLTKELAEASTKLKEYEDSKPGNVVRKTGGQVQEREVNDIDELRQELAKAR